MLNLISYLLMPVTGHLFHPNQKLKTSLTFRLYVFTGHTQNNRPCRYREIQLHTAGKPRTSGKKQAPTAKRLMTIMNQPALQIQRPTERKCRRPNKRDGRSFWQPDGTKEVRNLSSVEWLGLWRAPPATESTNTWRDAMKLQKQTVLQGDRRPLNGQRYPGKKKTPPRQPDLSTFLNGRTTPSASFTAEVHQASQSIAENVIRTTTRPTFNWF